MTTTTTTRATGLAKSGYRKSDIVARIVRHYRAASLDTIHAGRQWYATAQDVAVDIAETTDTRIDTVAGVIAALSPQTRWQANVDAARMICESGQRYPGMLKSNHQRALDVLGSDDPTGTALGKGNKVHAFAENILGDTETVTVDVWAVRAAIGSKSPVSLDVLLKRAGVYADIADCYRRAARIVNETPRELQAIVWVHVRGNAN